MYRTHTIRRLGFTIAATAACVAFAIAAHRPGGPRPVDRTIDAAVRTRVIDDAIARLDASYVFPDQAKAMGVALRTRLEQGGFDRYDRALAFADAVTDALQAVSHDRHLEVRYVDAADAERTSGAPPTPEGTDAERALQRRLNYGFASIERLHGNIGYLDLHQFGRPGGAQSRIAAAMALLADTDALIIDLRRCGGGDPDTVMQVASYFFDQRTHLNDIYWREENRTDERWTTDSVPGPRYGATRPLYLLTSADTFSGGEDFAYALKNAGRAILVGETTGGGAHPGDPRPLAEHFMMFVPSGRPINPVTHTDWEGVGVAPDVKTPADDALNVAQAAVLKRLIAAETDQDWRGKLQETLDELP